MESVRKCCGGIAIKLSILEKLIPLTYHLFPARCVLCEETTHRALSLCTDCEKALPLLGPHCQRCAHPIASLLISPTITCGNCLKTPPYFDSIYAPWQYTGTMRYLIQAFKFHQKRTLAYDLAQCFLSRFNAEKRFFPSVNRILSIPLHQSRLRERGFNQSSEITQFLNGALHCPNDNGAIMRQKATQPQFSLSSKARKRNLANAFSLKHPIATTEVILFDDIVTTGSTVNTVSRLLKENGVKQVHVWCLARTPSKQ